MALRNVTAGLVVIGNEILSGKVTDTNSPYLCRELRFLGVEVQRIVVIPDEMEVIGQTVREYSEQFTWVFTSGGIGPTHDDMTIPAIAAGFGVPVVESEEIVKTLRRYYGEKMTAAHLRMALVPENSTLIQNEALLSPQLQFRNVLILPGIPELLCARFNAIKEMFRQAPIFLREIFLKVDEGEIALALDAAMVQFPELLLGSYPALWRKDYTLKLTLESRNQEYLGQAYDFLRERLPPAKICEIVRKADA